MKYQMDIDAIWIIHLAESKTREPHIEDIKNFLNDNFDNVPEIRIWYTCKKPIFNNFVDLPCLKGNKTDSYVKAMKSNPYILSATFDCVFNHYQILKISRLLGYKKVLVLEDDCHFIGNPFEISNFIMNIPDDYSVCKLHYTSEDKYDLTYNLNDMYEQSNLKVWSTLAYIASTKGMDEYIKAFENNDIIPADLMFWKLSVKYVNKFKICEPFSGCSYIISNF